MEDFAEGTEDRPLLPKEEEDLFMLPRTTYAPPSNAKTTKESKIAKKNTKSERTHAKGTWCSLIHQPYQTAMHRSVREMVGVRHGHRLHILPRSLKLNATHLIARRDQLCLSSHLCLTKKSLLCQAFVVARRVFEAPRLTQFLESEKHHCLLATYRLQQVCRPGDLPRNQNHGTCQSELSQNRQLSPNSFSSIRSQDIERIHKKDFESYVFRKYGLHWLETGSWFCTTQRGQRSQRFNSSWTTGTGSTNRSCYCQ